jgi:hypothetical protein
MKHLPRVRDLAELENVQRMAEMVAELSFAPLGQERLGCFHGFSGWGKSSSVEICELAYHGVVVECTESMGRRGLMRRLCEPMGLPFRGTIDDLLITVGAALLESGRPVFFDDAQYLAANRQLIGIVRDLYKRAKQVVPFILVGEEGLPRLLSQVENVHNLVSVWTAAEQCSLDDAFLLADIYAKGVKVDTPLLEQIVIASNGTHRRVVNNIGKAASIARNRGLSTVSVTDWGDRSFFDGSLPVKRSSEQLAPKVKLTAAHRRAG